MAQLVVGLDIGTSAVRAAELDISHSQPVLLTYGQVGLPPGSLVDGEIRDGSSVTEAIKRLWENGQFSGSSVIVGIAGLRAITRELDLPFVPDNEVDSAVRFQSEEVIPFPPDQTILSSQILADYTSPEGDKMRRVLVAAAHTDLVNGVIDTVEKAGLTVVGVDLISSALVRAIGGHQESEQPEAIVSVGAGLTVVVVHQTGRPQFVRTIGMGGNATTAAISGALDVPLTDAEGMKRRLYQEDAQLLTARRAAQASMAELVGEIRNSIQYFASLPGRLPVSRVLVTGGGSALYGLLPMLEDQVHLPVLPVSPLARLNTSKLDLSDAQMNEVGPVLSTPIGLALPEPDKTVKKFNLLPPEVAKRARMKRIQERTLVGCVGVLVLLLGFGAWKFLQVHNAQNNVATLQSDISTLNAQVPKFDLVVAANNAYTSAVARRASVLDSAIDWPAVYDNLVAITPGGAEVQSFNGTSTSATGTGTAGATTAATGSTASASSASSSSTTSAAIGTVSLSVTGPGPSLSISEAWINAVSSSQLFANPLQGATVANLGGTISFPFTVSVTPQASLSKNASLK
jgi:type IV pilus assembly protein PilM